MCVYDCFEVGSHSVALASLPSAGIPNLGAEINKIVEHIVLFRFFLIIVTCLDDWWYFGMEFPIAGFFRGEDGTQEEGGGSSGGGSMEFQEEGAHEKGGGKRKNEPSTCLSTPRLSAPLQECRTPQQEKKKAAGVGRSGIGHIPSRTDLTDHKGHSLKPSLSHSSRCSHPDKMFISWTMDGLVPFPWSCVLRH